MEHVSGFAPLAERYDGFVLDLWGVIHDGVNAFPHAVDTLSRLKAMGKKTLLLSNAPRPNESVQRMMRRMGIEDSLYTGILTSGEAVRIALRNPPDLWWAELGTRVFHIGPERDRPILDGLPIRIVNTPAEADFVLNSGPDDHLDPTDMGAFEPGLQECARYKLKMICANPDLVVIRGGVKVLCAGSLAVRYQELGGDVRSLGKPDPAIYQPVLEQLGLPPDKVMAVGDSLRTDIAGANGVGLDACWVMDGIHGSALKRDDGSFDPAKAEAAAAELGVRPTATLPCFVW